MVAHGDLLGDADLLRRHERAAALEVGDWIVAENGRLGEVDVHHDLP